MEKSVSIDVHNLTVSYHQKPVLWNADFNIPIGVMAGIIGPNGSGKSTLLKSIMGLLEPSNGHVEIFGRTLDECRNKVAYVPQRESVDWDFPISVQEVVQMARYQPGKLFSRIKKSDIQISEHALEKVGMLPYANRQISQLSGGQQQRVFIARALAQQADLYLLDEPFAGVDAASEQAILKVLQELNEQGKTVVIVHHDLQTAQEYFEYLVMLNHRVIAAGPISEVFTDELLNEAYGGRLTILSKVGDLLAEKGLPVKEKDMK